MLCLRFQGTIHQAKDNALESRKGGNREPADRSTGFLGIVDLSTDDSFLTKTCQSPKLFLGIKQQS
jgi:hypothetical protein